MDDLEALLVGVLVRESLHASTLYSAAIHAALAAGDRAVSYEEVVAQLDGVLREFPFLGLSWEDPAKTRLRLIPGVRWFADSDTYRELARDPCERLARLFAEVSREALEHRVARPRVLVDSGAAAFHCLLHRNCHLAENASQILTTNLFVAQSLRGAKVKLIGGEWDLRKGALVNCADKPARLEQFLSARSRRPDVALLSFDSVRCTVSDEDEESNADDLELVAEDRRETQFKMAAFAATRLAVFVVFQARDVGRLTDGEAHSYPLSHLIPLQSKPQYAKRDVYLVTDLLQPDTRQQKVLNRLSSQRLRDHRIWLISPTVDTRPKLD